MLTRSAHYATLLLDLWHALSVPRLPKQFDIEEDPILGQRKSRPGDHRAARFRDCRHPAPVPSHCWVGPPPSEEMRRPLIAR
jgi:hypothetical protein